MNYDQSQQELKIWNCWQPGGSRPTVINKLELELPPGAALRRQAGNKEEFSSSRAETDLGLLEMTDQCWGQSEKFLPIDCRQIWYSVCCSFWDEISLRNALPALPQSWLGLSFPRNPREFNKTRLNLASPIIRSETPPHHTLISPLLVIRISQTGN